MGQGSCAANIGADVAAKRERAYLSLYACLPLQVDQGCSLQVYPDELLFQCPALPSPGCVTSINEGDAN